MCISVFAFSRRSHSCSDIFSSASELRTEGTCLVAWPWCLVVSRREPVPEMMEEMDESCAPSGCHAFSVRRHARVKNNVFFFFYVECGAMGNVGVESEMRLCWNIFSISFEIFFDFFQDFFDFFREYPRRCKTSLFGQSAGLSVLGCRFNSGKKSKNRAIFLERFFWRFFSGEKLLPVQLCSH